jgi:tetratricopeptide (TPR) repeat protein
MPKLVRGRLMRTLLIVASLLSVFAVSSLAQGSGGGGRKPGIRSRSRASTPDLTPNTLIFLSGKVVTNDGSVLTESVPIQTVCKGQKRTETHTDSHGSFSFQFGTRFGSSAEGEFDAENPIRSGIAGQPERRDLHDCELQASLAGFISDSIPLEGRFSGYENADVGRIVLHRLANVEGFTISATTAQAPKPAKKAFEKGRDQLQKGKWDDAQKSFEKAVTIFPKFAVAWFELGRLQLQRNDPDSARKSLQQSLAADPKYVNPYHTLTQIAQREQRWQELIETSEKLLALNPVSFPDGWFSNALGNYCLQNLAAAEKSARRGLEVDTEHRVVQLEYLLGVTLLERSDFEGAAQHLRVFVGHATKPADIAEGQRQLNEAIRLSAAVNLVSSERK